MPENYIANTQQEQNQTIPTFDQFIANLSSADWETKRYGAPPAGTVVAVNPAEEGSGTSFINAQTGEMTTKPMTSTESATKDNIATVVSLGDGAYRLVYKDGTSSDMLPGYLEEGFIGRLPAEGDTQTYVKQDGTTKTFDIGKSSNFFAKIGQGLGEALGDQTMRVVIPAAAIAAMAYAGYLAAGSAMAGAGGAGAAEGGADVAGLAGITETGIEGAAPTIGTTSAATSAGGAGGLATSGLIESSATLTPTGLETAFATPSSLFSGASNWLMPVLSGANALLGYDAARKAANTQADAITEAAKLSNQTQMDMFNKSLEISAPWREAGTRALGTLEEKMKAGPGEFTASPGYLFRQAEGQKAIERSAAAKGRVLSPSTSKALTRFGQDTASNEYQNWLANYYQSLTPYQSLSGLGMTTANTNANAATNVGSNIGSNYFNAGNIAGQAQAGGVINQANAVTGAINSGLNNYLLWKYFDNKTPTNRVA